MQRRVYRVWCRCMEGMAGKQGSADNGLYKIPLWSMSFYLRSWESHRKILSSRGITGSDLYCRKSTLDAVERLWSLDGVGTVVQGGAGGSFGLGLCDGKRSGSKTSLLIPRHHTYNLQASKINPTGIYNN